MKPKSIWISKKEIIEKNGQNYFVKNGIKFRLQGRGEGEYFYSNGLHCYYCQSHNISIYCLSGTKEELDALDGSIQKNIHFNKDYDQKV
jgi:hypothetical protein